MPTRDLLGLGRAITLRQRLLALIAVAVLPTATALLYLIFSIQSGREAEVSTAALRGSHTAAIEVEEALGNAEAILIAASAAPVVRNLAPTCSAYLAEVVASAPALNGLAIADAAGHVLCGTPSLPAGTRLPDGDWAARLPADGSRAVGTFTPAPGGAFLPIARREPATGHILMAGLALDWLQNRVEARGVPPGGSIVVADRNGVVLARVPDPATFVGKPLGPQAMELLRAPGPGAAMIDSPDGTRRIAGYQPAVGPAGLFVATGLSTEAAFGALRASTLRSLALAGAGTLAAALVALWFGDRLFRRPVRHILATLDRWRAGDETARIGLAPDLSELAVLAAAIDDYMDSLAAARAARESAEGRRQLLLHEMNHRIKNVLAAVQAIANQTFRNSATPASLTVFGNRLRAMAAAHDLLVRESWESTDISRALHASIDPFGAGRFTLEGPDVQVGASAALAFGMAIHELCTNAAKYGALAVPEGRVTIRWHLEPEPDAPAPPPGEVERDGTDLQPGGPILHFSWIERGGPPVVPPNSTGFGSQLVRAAFTGEFGAESQFDFDPAGLRFHLRMEARRLAPAPAPHA